MSPYFSKDVETRILAGTCTAAIFPRGMDDDGLRLYGRVVSISHPSGLGLWIGSLIPIIGDGLTLRHVKVTGFRATWLRELYTTEMVRTGLFLCPHCNNTGTLHKEEPARWEERHDDEMVRFEGHVTYDEPCPYCYDLFAGSYPDEQDFKANEPCWLVYFNLEDTEETEETMYYVVAPQWNTLPHKGWGSVYPCKTLGEALARYHTEADKLRMSSVSPLLYDNEEAAYWNEHVEGKPNPYAPLDVEQLSKGVCYAD